MQNETNIGGVVFMNSYFQSIENLEDNDQLEMYRAVFGFSFENRIPTFTKKHLNAVWQLILPTLQSSIDRYKASTENGKKGGRPKTTTTAVTTKSETVVETKSEPTPAEANDEPTLGVYPEQDNEYSRIMDEIENRQPAQLEQAKLPSYLTMELDTKDERVIVGIYHSLSPCGIVDRDKFTENSNITNSGKEFMKSLIGNKNSITKKDLGSSLESWINTKIKMTA